jgi:hypothetical protein
VWAGGALTVLAVAATVALAVAIPTQGENPRAWGVVVCGLVTVGLCVQLTVRNRRLLRHYRGDDLPAGRSRGVARLRPAVRLRQAAPPRQARAKAAR